MHQIRFWLRLFDIIEIIFVGLWRGFGFLSESRILLMTADQGLLSY